jgi:hypothetical protein
MDLRRQPLLGAMNAIGVVPTQGNLGIANARRIFAGSSAQSVLWARVQNSQVGVHMPPQGRAADPAAVSLLAQWINGDLSVLDSDADTRADASDNCPYVANDQRDFGGIGLVSGPDGIGDACQCGDLLNDGRITSVDTAALRSALANGASSLNLALCNAHDPAGAAPGRCDLVDVVAMTRGLAGVSPGISQRCRAAGVIP